MADYNMWGQLAGNTSYTPPTAQQPSSPSPSVPASQMGNGGYTPPQSQTPIPTSGVGAPGAEANQTQPDLSATAPAADRNAQPRPAAPPVSGGLPLSTPGLAQSNPQAVSGVAAPGIQMNQGQPVSGVAAPGAQMNQGPGRNAPAPMPNAPGVGGLGSLLQLLMGGASPSGNNPLMSLLQSLAQAGGRSGVQQAGMPSNNLGIANRPQGWVDRRLDPGWVATRMDRGPGGGGIPPAMETALAGPTNPAWTPTPFVPPQSGTPLAGPTSPAWTPQPFVPPVDLGGDKVIAPGAPPTPDPFFTTPIPNAGPSLSGASSMATAMSMLQSQNPMIQAMAPLLIQQLLGRRG